MKPEGYRALEVMMELTDAEIENLNYELSEANKIFKLHHKAAGGIASWEKKLKFENA